MIVSSPGAAIAGDRLWAYLERVSLGLDADQPGMRRVNGALLMAGGLLAIVFGFGRWVFTRTARQSLLEG